MDDKDRTATNDEINRRIIERASAKSGLSPELLKKILESESYRKDKYGGKRKMSNLRSGGNERPEVIPALVCIHTNKGEVRETGQLRYTRHLIGQGKEVQDEIHYTDLLHPTEVEVFRRRPQALYDDFARQARADEINEANLALAQAENAIIILKEAMQRSLRDTGMTEEEIDAVCLSIEGNVVKVTKEKRDSAEAFKKSRGFTNG
jgi:hypothetical protein